MKTETKTKQIGRDMNEEEVKKLYNALVKKGYSTSDIGHEKDFVTKMEVKENRRKLYDHVLSRGDFRIGDYDTYERRLTVSPTPLPDNNRKRDYLPEWQMERKEATGPTLPQGVRDEKPGQTGSPLAGSHAREVAEEYDRSVMEDEQGGGTDALAQADGLEEAGRKLAATARNVAEGAHDLMEDTGRRLGNLEEYGRKALGKGMGQAVTGDYALNPQTGKMERTYLTPTGERTFNKVAAEEKSREYREAVDMTVGGQIRRVERRRAEIAERLARRGRELDEQAKQAENKPEGGIGFLNDIVGSMAGMPRGGRDARMPAAVEGNGRMQDGEYKKLHAALRQSDEQIRTLRDQQDREKGIDVGFWRGFMRTAGDLRSWDFGMGDLMDATAMAAHDTNYSQGENKASRLMMQSAYENQQAESMYGGNASFWNRAGMMTGYMPSFMLDFALTGGGYEGINVASRVAGKAATKALGKEAVKNMAKQGFKTYIKNNGLKGLGQEAANWTIKALGTTTDELLIRAPLMTNTVQAGDTVADIIDRKLGDVTVDENGNYDFTNDKTWGSAIWQGEANSIVENYSEMFGTHLPEVASLKNLGKLADVIGAKRLSGMLARANAGALGGITETTRRIFGKMGVNDYVGEVGEEYYGQLWRTMLNLDDAYQQNADGTRTNLFATNQFHGDIWGGMALSMGLMGAGKATMSAASYLSMKHDVNKADARASELFTPDEWEPLRMTLDMTTNEHVGDVAEAVWNDPDFTPEQKAAVLNYMELSLYLRGASLAELVKSRGGEQDEVAQQLKEGYMDGYNAHGTEEMQDVRNMYEMQKTIMMADLGIDEEELSSTDWVNEAMVAAGTDTESGKRRAQVILDYLNAKQVYDGMIQRVRDDMDGRIEQAGAMVDSRVNRAKGTIQGVTMKVQDDEGNDRRAYVLDGNLAMLPDGTGIDHEKSSGSILLRYEDTGEMEMVSPDAILSMEQPVDPELEKRAAAEAIRQQYGRQEAGRIEGVLPFNQGDTYTLTDENGQQSQIQIVPNQDGIVDNGNGTVNVSSDGGVTVVPMSKDDIQFMSDATNRARVLQSEQQREAMRAEQTKPEYSLNTEVTLRDEAGNAVRGSITADMNEDGLYEVYTESPINGRKVNLFTADELNVLNYEQPEQTDGNIGQENIPEPTAVFEQQVQKEAATQQQQPSAFERIPKDEKGEPIYEQTDADTAWDAIVEQSEGDEATAKAVADSMVADKEAELKKAEKAKTKGGTTVAEKIAAEREHRNAVEQAKATLAYWRKIAQTAERRRQAAMAEQAKAAAEAARLRREQEEKERTEHEEADRIRREALNGVPDIIDDKPQDARARGYRRVNGEKVDRQQPLQAKQGKEVQVKFDDKNIPTGRVSLIEAEQLQPSHVNGRRNPAHFIDEAQPKERNDEASVMSARNIAANIRPEEITSSVTAYTGAPTVNTRGEVIQGNNRSAALREMWAGQPGQAAKYKQYLAGHAADFGLTPEDVEAMQRPVLVNMLDVVDDDAITLGQFVAQDTESGGTERIKPKNIVQKMGGNMRGYANQLLKSVDDEASFAELVDRNGMDVLKWMRQKGYITPTQYKSAFDSKGNLTAEAKNDLKGIMYQSIFQNGNTHLEEMFGALPAKAQKAILATAYRDYDSPNVERMNRELQDSISAYYALSQLPEFANAKNYKEARIAAEAWKRQFALDDVTGESYLPSERYSNFAILLATMYKGQTQTFIQNTFKNIYDLVQGMQEETLFETPDNTPRTLVEAINETLSSLSDELLLNGNFIYNGQRGSNVLVGDSTAGQEGIQGSTGSAPARGRIEDGNGATDRSGGTESDSRQSNQQGQATGSNNSGTEGDSEGQQEYTISEKKSGNGEPFYQDSSGNIDLANIPDEVFEQIGYTKAPFRLTPSMMLHVLNSHGKELGVSSVDETVRFVLDVMNNFDHVRLGYDGALIFSIENGRTRTGKRAITILINSDNGQFYGLKSSGYEAINGLNKRPLLWERGAKDSTSSTDAASASVTTGKSPLNGGQSGSASHQRKDLSSSFSLHPTTQVEEPVPLNDSNKPTATDNRPALLGINSPELSESKDSKKAPVISGLGEKIAEEEKKVNVNPTEGQKEAGNYKKGHVRIGQFDVSIEQPKGSVRSGVDASGKKWEHTMQNTYGYIRGTEGVDGDHIDVFLTNDIDGWNGRRVYVVDQYNEDGTFDEHKVMLGFNDEADAQDAYLSNYEKGWENKRKLVMTSVNLPDFEKWINSSHRKTKPFAEYKGVKILQYAPQGNPMDENGKLIVERVSTLSALTDEDFMTPFRSVELPPIPKVVSEAIGSHGKPVIIKKNIFEKNRRNHSDVTPSQSREILQSALYSPDLYGQNQKGKRPYNWIVINTKDEAGHNRLVLLEVNDKEDYAEIVHWHYIDQRGLEKIRRQAQREDGQLLILPSVNPEEVGALSDPTINLSPKNKDTISNPDKQTEGTEIRGAYSIMPAQYTTKRGTVLDMYLVKFANPLSKEQQRVAKELAKVSKGWYDAKQGGFMMRSEEGARQLVDEVVPHEVDLFEMAERIAKEAEGKRETKKEPLNENEIWNTPFPKITKDGATAYINGNINFATSIAYQQIYNYVWNRPEDSEPNSARGNSAQPIVGLDDPAGGRSGRDGVQAGNLVGRTNQSGGGKNHKGVDILPVGEGSDTVLRGEASGNDGLSSGSDRRDGGGRTGRDGNDVRKREGERGRGKIVGEDLKQGGHASHREVEECLDEIHSLLADFERAGKKNLSLSVVGMNAEQIEIAGKILVAGVRLGYAYVKTGITKFEEWTKAMHGKLASPLAESMKLTHAEIDEFIMDMWEYPYTVDGETRLLKEWASILGKEELRKNIAMTLEEKRKAQQEAEEIGVKVCDRENIADTLPFLLPQQQDDVMKAETQFFDESHNDREHAFGKGYMFTNGTGTGKTYTGLGIVKRFIKQGKGRILILTPSQTKVTDWVKDAGNLGVELKDLDQVAKAKRDGTAATKEKGEGAVVTTYANFRQNKALLEERFDLIVYDESHRLLENKEGTGTTGAMQHYKVSNRNEQYAYLRLQEIHPVWNELQSQREAFDEKRNATIERLKKEYGISHELTFEQRSDLPPVFNGNWVDETENRFPELAKLRKEILTLNAKYTNEVKPELERQAKENVRHTKVVFLSATPFNTRENLDYSEGYIFSYPERETQDGYGTQSPRSQFYLEHFGAGYRWRYHRLESSGTNPEAVSRQEVEFSDYLQYTLGTMSGRIIDSPFDYSRDFPTVTLDKAEEFNTAMEELSRDDATRGAYYEVMGDYNYTSALFESMKVGQIIPRLKEHFSRGRKVVVFHRRVESKNPLAPPFKTIFDLSTKALEGEHDATKKAEKKRKITSLRRKCAGMLEWEQGLDLRMPREQLAEAFGKDKVLFFSGKESKKAKDKAVADFNSDNSGKDIIVIQESSGKEGISLHDTTGVHQRVLVTLALPQSPITALQIEGRIYRIGNKSNAIFEYPLLGLNSELILFGRKFNQQVSTTENLALGSQARNLRESFARGVEEHSGDVDPDKQGVGGKEFDTPNPVETDAFDRAVLDYYTNQKLTGKRDSREGEDYYPTPEPLGYMMSQWGRIGYGESVLEPSAGHGAIARYVPKDNLLTAVEPSQSLFSKLQIKAGGNGRKFENIVFEDYNVANKHDVVLMNPPFGVGGRLAVNHVAKAFRHLEEGGRIVALIPRGAADKKFDKWYGEQKDAVLTADISLPDITFERAGTSVNCRVVVIDKVTSDALRSSAASRAVHIDLSREHYEKIEDFFEEIRDIDVPERTIDQQAKLKKKAAPVARELRTVKGVRDVYLGEDKIFVSGSGVWTEIEWGDRQGEELTSYLAGRYRTFKGNYDYAVRGERATQEAVYGEMKDLACKLAGMTEDEMQRYIGRKGDDVLYRNADENLDKVNDRFNEELEGLREENADSVVLSLGRPSAILRAAGVEDKPMKLYGNKVIKKMKKHGFKLEELRDLPEAVANPIAVFNNYGKEGNRSVLTELQIGDKHILASITVGKDGVDADFNIISSVFGKGSNNIVDWINKGYATYINKKKALDYLHFSESSIPEASNNQEPESKALNYLHLSAPIAEALDSTKLSSAANIVRNFENPKFEDENLRGGNGVLTDDDLDIANDPVSKFVGKSTRTAAQRKKFAERERERMVERVRELAEKLHLDNVDIVTDVSGLQGRRAKAKGFFSRSTGKITIVIPNHASVADVEQTLLHEAVAHYGLRQLFGKHFDTFLRNVYENADVEVRQRITELASHNGWDYPTATEEYLASLAENTNFEDINASWWSKIKDLFLKMLHKIGFKDFSGVTLSDNELRYILWRSYENLAEPGRYRNILGEAADVAKQAELKVGNYTGNPSPTDMEVAEAGELEEVNERFNEKLSGLTEENADKVVLNLGKPSDVLRAAGVADKPMKLYGSKVIKKMKKHGFNLEELRDLPYSVANPIAVFNNYGKEGSRSILTELRTDQGNFLVTLNVGKGVDIDFNIVSSVFGKGEDNIVDWIERGLTTYIDKKKALDYLHHSALLAEALSRPRLSRAAKIVENFENPTIRDEKDGDDVLLFRGGEDGDAVRTATEIYEEGVANTLAHRWDEAWHDYLRSVRVLQESLSKALGRKIDDYEDVYLHALHKSSVDNREWLRMMKKYVRPLNDALHKITHGKDVRFRGRAVTLDDIEVYLNSKHGLERNEDFAMRDAEETAAKGIKKAEEALAKEEKEAGRMRDRTVLRLEKRLSKGEIDVGSYGKAVSEVQAEYVREMAEARAACEKTVDAIRKKIPEYYAKNRERDYSGLTALFDPEGKGLGVWELERAAAAYAREFEESVGWPLLGELWDKVREMNRYSLRKSYESGLIGKESYERTLNRFTYYVPLRGFDGETAADVYDYITEGEMPMTKVLKHAKGRKSRAKDLIATMMNMGHSAIVSGNRNMVKQRLLNLALNADNALLSVSDQWYDRVGEDEWVPAREPSLSEGMSAEEVRKAIEDYESEMKAKEERGEAKRMKKGVKLNVRIDSKRKEYEHGVRVKRGGRDYVVWVNGNPKAAQSVNGLLNPETKHSFVTDALRTANRFISKNVTAFNPKFLMRNLKRDILSANLVGFAKYGSAYTMRFDKYVKDNLSLVDVKGARAGRFSGIYDLYIRYEKGMLDMNVKRDRHFKEFIENGGETGYSQLWSIEDYQQAILKSMDRGSVSESVRNGIAAIGAGAEFMNRGIENVCRFAAYMASRDMGLTVLESVRDAKEASVNFNRKGSGALGNDFARAVFMFMNPSIQGMVQLVQLTRRYPKRVLPVLGGVMGLGVLSVLVAASVGGGDDDDDYYNLNPFVRRSNLIVRIGPHEYLRWDLPPDLRPWYGLGEIACSALLGKMEYESVPLAVLSQLSQILPLDPVNETAILRGDESNLKGVVKNVTRATGLGSWLDAYIFDEDFTGRKISGATDYNKLDPEWKRAGFNTSELMIGTSRTLNRWSGGNDSNRGWVDFNPSRMEHFLKGVMGGWTDFPVSVVRGCEAFFSDDDDVRLDTRNYPVLGDSYIRTDNRRMRNVQVNTAYQWYKHEYELTGHKLKSIAADKGKDVFRRAEEADELAQSPEGQRYRIFSDFKRYMDELYELLDETEDEGKRKETERKLDGLKKELVERLERTQGEE